MDADVILVGGGLANCLIALKLKRTRPGLKTLLLERGSTFGGNHTWSFHGSDITPAQLLEVEDLIERSWASYDIRFPDRSRRLSGGYHSIISEHLHSIVCDALGDRAIVDTEVATVRPDRVELVDGRSLTAPAIIDGRGDPGNQALWVAYQKFVGWIVTLKGEHGLDVPLIMDSTIEQRDGFRFFYLLPLSPSRLLIEDTRYSDSPDLDRIQMRHEIESYINRSGWSSIDIEREEEGVLPVVLGGDLEAFWADDRGVPRSGVRAGLFNYTTGYSFPEAVRCADAIAAAPKLDSAALYSLTRKLSEKLWRRGGFLRMINRMLFLAASPNQRYRVLQHFYRLPEATINRLYSGEPKIIDKLRMLSGKPPVPVGSALSAIFRRHPQSVA